MKYVFALIKIRESLREILYFFFHNYILMNFNKLFPPAWMLLRRMKFQSIEISLASAQDNLQVKWEYIKNGRAREERKNVGEGGRKRTPRAGRETNKRIAERRATGER